MKTFEVFGANFQQMGFGGKFPVGRFSLTDVYKPLKMIVLNLSKSIRSVWREFSANVFSR